MEKKGRKSFRIENRPKDHRNNYLLISVFGWALIVFGFLSDSPNNIVKGIYQIITSSDVLIADYFGIGGIGATFVNAGLLYLISLFLLYRMRIPLSGASVASVFMMGGFGMFGKNLLNVWPIVIGVYLYSKIQKERFESYVYMALFGTAMAPMVTEAFFFPGHGFLFRCVVSLGTGLTLGILIPPLSTHMFRFHQGFSLYNIGFAAGIISTVFISVLASFGYRTKTQLIWTMGNNKVLALFLCSMMLLMILLGFLFNRRSFKNYGKILTYEGRSITDFLLLEGLPTTLVNMGICGLIAISYVLLIGSDLNGPTIGGVFSIVGFAAFGKHPKNILPILLGVFLSSFVKKWDVNQPAVVLAALFGTSLAPIAGAFGWKYGLLAAFIHSSVVLNVGKLYGGVNLYNNGFSTGLVAAFLVPIIQAFRSRED